MGLQDFISEGEAMSLTGMSKTTLSRFAEAGYLQLETDQDGLRMFSKAELASLFGLKETPTARTQPVEPKPEPITATAEVLEVEEKPLPLSERIEKFIENRPAFVSEPTPISEPAKPDQTHEMEMRRLRNVLELQERILDMKDQQLRDLKQQRDWLQSRIEKLEDKADRDQILLLTETQTIRNLVNMNQANKKRSAMRLALEWLGVAAPENESKSQNGEDIEVLRKQD